MSTIPDRLRPGCRGAPKGVNASPMDGWTPEEISAHITYMDDFVTRLQQSGEFVDSQALSPDGLWVRYDGEGRRGQP